MSKEFKSSLKKFLPKIRDAKEKNLNEADTRMRIRVLFSDVLGYDLLEDITQEHMVSGHYVDLTVKYKGKIIFFVEAKSVDTVLRDTHVYQATNYAATGGVNLCLLTNAIDYRLYYLNWNKEKVESNLILSFNIIEDDINQLADKLYLLSKNSFKKGLMDKYIAEITSLGDKNLLQALLSKKVLSSIRRELKDITGYNIKDEAIERFIVKLFPDELYNSVKAGIKRKRVRETKGQTSKTEITRQENTIEESTAIEAKSNNDTKDTI